MNESPLEDRIAALLRRLRKSGIEAALVRDLPYGLQYQLSRQDRVCKVNFYYSKKKGLSVVGSGGDENLLAASLEILEEPPGEGSSIGTDEAGKGDYLGGIAVCACCCSSTAAGELRRIGVGDSKRFDKERIAELSALISEIPDCSWFLNELSAFEYNRAFRRFKARGENSVDILARAHADTVRAALESGCVPDRIIVDMFCVPERLLRFMPEGDFELDIHPRAESNPVVAAASILARKAYLDQLAALGEELDCPLSPGSGAEVDALAARLVKAHGQDILDKVAKVHFRNTQRVKSLSLKDS